MPTNADSGIPPRKATKIIPHNIDVASFKQILRLRATEGAPSINRATRRKAKRVGDAARRKANDGSRASDADRT